MSSFTNFGSDLERLLRCDVSWWKAPGRLEAARALADVWAARSQPPADAVLPWPTAHGVADLLAVLLIELGRAGADPQCPQWDAALAAWRL